jgi:hypothetical protein
MAMSVLALLLWAGPAAAVSVTEFGAMGDGRADDTRAIQAALESSFASLRDFITPCVRRFHSFAPA